LRGRRGTAAAIALLCAALAVAGCGIGAGAEVGEVSLTVTRDYGRQAVLSIRERANESDTVMRLLDRHAELSTRYGGGFVRSIDGVSEAVDDGRRFDWFFYVNGVESPVGAADFALRGGDAVWWDYRDWTSASRVPAVVGSWPQPFLSGYEGGEHPVSVECEGAGEACATVRRRLRAIGARLGGSEQAIRVLVGPWERLRGDRTAALLERGPQESGVFAGFQRRRGAWRLVGLTESGEPRRLLARGVGLVAATRRFDAPPVWLVTGADASGVAAAAALLDRPSLRDHYAVATEGEREVPLPLR
jgi:hypothetical protein